MAGLEEVRAVDVVYFDFGKVIDTCVLWHPYRQADEVQTNELDCKLAELLTSKSCDEQH